jgi:hypothetical protein
MTFDVLDVVVDARPGSAIFGRVITSVLDDQLCTQVYIPRGFLHGFQAPMWSRMLSIGSTSFTLRTVMSRSDTTIPTSPSPGRHQQRS